MIGGPDKKEEWLLDSETLKSENLDNFRSIYDIMLRINYLKKVGIKNLQSKHIDLSSKNPTIYDILLAIKEIWTLDKPGVAFPIDASPEDIGKRNYNCWSKVKILTSGIDLNSHLKLLDEVNAKSKGESSFYKLNYFNIGFNDIGEHNYTFYKYPNASCYLFVVYSPPTDSEADLNKLPFEIPTGWKIFFQRSGIEHGLDDERFIVLKKEKDVEESVSFKINWLGSFNSGYFAYFCGEDLDNFEQPIITQINQEAELRETTNTKKVNWIVNVYREKYSLSNYQDLWKNENERHNLIIDKGDPLRYSLSYSDNAAGVTIISLLFQEVKE